MEPQPFRVSIRIEAGRVILDLAGEIDSFAKAALDEAYAAASGREAQSLLLNFTRVTYINSTGIALIVSLLADSMKSRRRLAAYGLNPHYLEIFRITRLANYISIYPSELEALGLPGSSKPESEDANLAN